MTQKNANWKKGDKMMRRETLRKETLITWMLWMVLLNGVNGCVLCVARVWGQLVSTKNTLWLAEIWFSLFAMIMVLGFEVSIPLFIEAKRGWQVMVCMLAMIGFLCVATFDQVQTVGLLMRLFVTFLALAYLWFITTFAFACSEW